MNCPGFEQLLDYLDGRLDGAAENSSSAHLGLGCDRCLDDRAWYQELRLIAASDDSIEPPPWVLRRAMRLFTITRRAGVGARLRGVVAALVFDSSRRPALAGVRKAGAETRQLLYRAEDYSIDVQVAAPNSGRAQLSGQILREGELFESVAGLQLDLLKENGTILSTVTNDRGEFTIRHIEFGNYDLRVVADHASITIVGLPVE